MKYGRSDRAAKRLVPDSASTPSAVDRGTSGYTLIELLVVAVIIVVAVVSVGTGFARLSSLEESNREKARVLEALCVRAAVMQPRVAIGAAVTTLTADSEVKIRYPKIIFGVAFETNQFLQVTNYVMRIRDATGTLEGQVYSAKETNQRREQASYGWADTLFIRQSRQSQMIGNSMMPITDWADPRVTNGLLVRYSADVPMMSNRVQIIDEVSLTVPVRLRNGNGVY